VIVAAGDSGYGVNYPAASPWVTAVGGTTLSTATNARGWTETAWAGTSSGCSALEPKPAWQIDVGCPTRTVADMAADADPVSGAAVYDTYQRTGWVQVGGTSLAAPLVAGIYALGLANQGAVGAEGGYEGEPLFNDVTSGADGACTVRYLCAAGPGYDGPTGVGTPNGVLGPQIHRNSIVRIVGD